MQTLAQNAWARFGQTTTVDVKVLALPPTKKRNREDDDLDTENIPPSKKGKKNKEKEEVSSFKGTIFCPHSDCSDRKKSFAAYLKPHIFKWCTQTFSRHVEKVHNFKKASSTWASVDDESEEESNAKITEETTVQVLEETADDVVNEVRCIFEKLHTIFLHGFLPYFSSCLLPFDFCNSVLFFSI